MRKIRIAVAGVGNCASSLIQGIHYYKNGKPGDAIGLMHWNIGGYTPGDIEVVAAFDIDRRKVGRDLHEAIFAEPNCTAVFYPDLPSSGVTVCMGKILDGISDHMREYGEKYSFSPADDPEPDAGAVVAALSESGAQILLNYMPVGAEKAARFYAECSLEAGVAIDAIRCVRLALDRGEGGVLEGPSAYFCKHPPQQHPDDEAYRMTNEFIRERSDDVHEKDDPPCS